MTMPSHTETPKEMLRELERGKSPNTPFIALTSVTVVVVLAVAAVCGIIIAAIFIAS